MVREQKRELEGIGNMVSVGVTITRVEKQWMTVTGCPFVRRDEAMGTYIRNAIIMIESINIPKYEPSPPSWNRASRRQLRLGCDAVNECSE